MVEGNEDGKREKFEEIIFQMCAAGRDSSLGPVRFSSLETMKNGKRGACQHLSA